MRPSTLIQVARAVQAVIDKSWIPEELRGPSYFSSLDEWQFLKSDSPNMCPVCEGYDLDLYGGYDIRELFPYLGLQTENLIYPRVHPNCLCTLVRVFPVEADPDKQSSEYTAKQAESVAPLKELIKDPDPTAPLTKVQVKEVVNKLVNNNSLSPEEFDDDLEVLLVLGLITLDYRRQLAEWNKKRKEVKKDE